MVLQKRKLAPMIGPYKPSLMPTALMPAHEGEE
jgi:hypothetical protein